MPANKVTHYYPDARAIFVRRFQKSGEDLSDSDAIIAELGDIVSVSISRTVKNSPGTFSINLNNKEGKFLESDDPETDVAALYRGSKRGFSRRDVQYGSKRTETTKPETQPIEGEAGEGATTPELTEVVTAQGRKELDNTTVDAGVASFYEFSALDNWKSFTHACLEDPDDPGSRFIISYIRDVDSGAIKERWALDDFGRVIYVTDSPATEAEFAAKLEGTLASNPEADTIGFEYECDVLDEDQSKKSQAYKKTYRVYWYKNNEFFTKYKDTDLQGPVDSNEFLRGRCKISPMDRIVIFMSERFPAEDGVPRLKRVFTGVVSTVQDGWSTDNATIQITGEDVTKYLQLSVINANPAMLLDNITAIDQEPQANITIWENIFKTKTVPEIIKAILLGSDAVEGEFGGGNTISGIGYYQLAKTGKAKDIRFNGDNGRLEYIEGSKAVDNRNTYNFKEMLGELFDKASVHIQNPYRKGTDLTGFRAYELELKNSWSFYQADFKTRREIAYKSAEDSHFVFYADGDGHIWFHPPRYTNAHILCAPNPKVFVIDPESVISYGFIEDESQIYSSVYVTTEPDFGLGNLQNLGRYTASYRDDVVVLKYGQRLFTYSNPIIRTGTQEHIRLYAKSLLQRMLANKYQGQITITGRAEIEPGYPIYVPERNRVYYVESIDHSLAFGGQFTTTLHISYGRKPWEHIAELLTFSDKDDLFLGDGHVLAQTLAEEIK